MTEQTTATMFSSKEHDWETSEELFGEMHRIFQFTIDLAADITNFKLRNFINKDQNYLKTAIIGETGWLNPPYAKKTKSTPGQIDFLAKAATDGESNNIVCLILARTETEMWQEIIFKKATVVVFLKGRLKFKGAKNVAPFPSAVAVFGDISKRQIERLRAFGKVMEI